MQSRSDLGCGERAGARGGAFRLIFAFASALTVAASLAGAQESALRLVRLRDVDPTIEQEMIYATAHNFTGKPVPGYEAAECWLAEPAARALSRAQADARIKGFSLLVYDCYRPEKAVAAFVAWATTPGDEEKKYYPHLKKSQLIPTYIASPSGHSTGLAVDVTLIEVGKPIAISEGSGDCTAPPGERYGDNSVDMGTAFDCFDPKASTAFPAVTEAQRRSRQLLHAIMEDAGFVNYPEEWWHFTFKRSQ